MVLQDVPQNGFGDGLRVEIGGIDEVSTGLDEGGGELTGFGGVTSPGIIAECHGAEAGAGNEEAGAAELLVNHIRGK